jgi:hypothetical protein
LYGGFDGFAAVMVSVLICLGVWIGFVNGLLCGVEFGLDFVKGLWTGMVLQRLVVWFIKLFVDSLDVLFLRIVMVLLVSGTGLRTGFCVVMFYGYCWILV